MPKKHPLCAGCMLGHMTARSQSRCGFKMEKLQQLAGRMTFSPFAIIMSELLLHLAWGTSWKCFSEGKSFQLHVSFKISIPMYLLETFQETTFPFPSLFSNAILPSQHNSQTALLPGPGKGMWRGGKSAGASNPFLCCLSEETSPLPPYERVSYIHKHVYEELQSLIFQRAVVEECDFSWKQPHGQILSLVCICLILPGTHCAVLSYDGGKADPADYSPSCPL